MTKFKENIIRIYGNSGGQWFDNLPKTIEHLSIKWNLSNLKVHQNLSYNYILDGLQNKQPIILKIGYDKLNISNEFDALSVFQNHGVIKMYDTDLENGALLLERAVPGKTLKSLFPVSDNKAMEIACTLIDNLHRAKIPSENNFPTLENWLQIIDKDWDLPKEHLLRARELKEYLLKSTQQIVMLHGDLHYDNILSCENHWKVIDPKGVIGDATYDKTGCLLREPLKELLQTKDVVSLLSTRINLVSKHFNLEIERIIDWTYVQTVMAICWCFEDNQNPSDMLKFLNVITSTMKD